MQRTGGAVRRISDSDTVVGRPRATERQRRVDAWISGRITEPIGRARSRDHAQR
jgi:hypothetical protein